MGHILWIDAPEARGSSLLGGKLSSLADMIHAGFHVPPCFGITTTAYAAFMTGAGLDDLARDARERAAATDDLAEIHRISAELATAIVEASLPERLEADIRTAYARLGETVGDPDVPVAVRSSGESEDLDGASFAGQYDTYLWISGIEAVLAHVRKCWAGMFGPAVLTYKSAAPADAGICVGVQQMVPARSAGVMFTLDPVTGDRSKVVIEGAWGLGEGVVSGAVTPSRFVVDKVTGERVRTTVAPQQQMFALDAATGATGLVPVPEDRREQRPLDDDHVTELVALAKRIERHKGAPMDIEWALTPDGEVRVLQVRPETVWSSRAAEPVVRASANPVDHVLARFAGTKVTRRAGS
jgi:pyruvate,water dikinase